jgi:uncharacterized protein (TIGR00251 family)
MPIANLESFAISDRVGAVRFDVRARPRASRTEIIGIKEGALEVAIAAPPADGEANLELARGLASIFGLHARDVLVVAGASGKRKVVEMRRIDSAATRARLVGYIR